MSEAYDALLLSDSKANGATKAINNITDYQIDNIVTKKIRILSVKFVMLSL